MPISIWNSLLGSSQFHMNIWNSLIGSAKFHMKFPNWKYPISYEIDSLEVPSFIWIIEFPFYEFPYLEVQMFIYIPYLEVPDFIWISMFGSAKFHMNFLAWTCKFSFQTAKFHMIFSVWKCQISYEFSCFEIPNFIWTFEIPWLEGLNFIWISLSASTQFQMNKWNCQI